MTTAAPGRIDVNSVSKTYCTYASEWQRVAGWFGLRSTARDEYCVVKSASFTVVPGHTVGIIGQNGAGKSTLLKLLMGTLSPTSGNVVMGGRVCGILELGMGFNFELSARENVFHAAGLMGFTAEQIQKALPDIEEFAEVGEYFDQPMRTFSSGMQMRVAFAVVTAWRPDVLVIDEVLAVGDSYFQHKSFGRIRQFKAEGTTIVFVSHGLASVRELCDRVLLIEKGQIVKDGMPDEVIDYYNAMIAAKETSKLTIEQRRLQDGWLLTRSGTGEAALQSLQLLDAHSLEPVSVAQVGQHMVLVAVARVLKRGVPRLVLGYMLKDRTGHVVWGTNTWHTKQVVEAPREGATVTYKLAFTCELGPGSYSFSPALVSTDTHLVNNYEWTDNALVFDVINSRDSYFIGSSALDCVFAVTTEQGA